MCDCQVTDNNIKTKELHYFLTKGHSSHSQNQASLFLKENEVEELGELNSTR